MEPENQSLAPETAQEKRSLAPRIPAGLAHHFVKFNVVGAIGIGVQLLALWILKGWLGWHYLVATGLAVEAAIVHNFIWHETWTWADRTRGRRSGVTRRLIRFNSTTGLVSLLGNLVLMQLLVGLAGLPYFLANILSIAACSILTFLLSDRFVFLKQA